MSTPLGLHHWITNPLIPQQRAIKYILQSGPQEIYKDLDETSFFVNIFQLRLPSI
jgi:hypothetical protein